jgi:hypothetical protein
MAKTVEMHVPNKSYNGYYGGVKFNRGVGVFEDVEAAKALAERYGYEIKGDTAEAEAKEEKPKAAPKKRAPRKKAAPKDGE